MPMDVLVFFCSFPLGPWPLWVENLTLELVS
jgi:hypothetical protein